MKCVKNMMIIYGVTAAYFVFIEAYGAIIPIVISVLVIDNYVKNEKFREKINHWI